MSRHRVAALRTEARYPTAPPFHPSEAYPEYPFGSSIATGHNAVYEGVRDLLHLLGYDAKRFGTKDWNPLGALIEPGMAVVLKPNWVLSRHRQGGDLFALVTHPAVLRAVADYAWIALGGRGSITIADVPQYDCNFAELAAASHFDELTAFYQSQPGPTFEIRDLRRYWSPGKHFNSQLQRLPGDPRGSVVVNLGADSALYDKPSGDKLYGAVYHRDETISRHTGRRHEYELSRTILDADVVISVPKLKVHKKVGTTLNVKGLVGANTNKNLLVHYTLTSPKRGGDQYPDGLFTPVEEALIRIERWMYDHLLAPRQRVLEYIHRSIYAIHNRTTKRLGLKVAEWKRQLDAGNWHGNDSAWRMAVDLMRIFTFADTEGRLQRAPQRRVLSIVDGIIGGDNNGPLLADAVPAGTLIGGENLLAVDIVATRLMGFDPAKVKTLATLLADPAFDLGVRSYDDIEVVSTEPGWSECLDDDDDRYLAFRPHPGWVGHIEVEPRGDARALASSTAHS